MSIGISEWNSDTFHCRRPQITENEGQPEVLSGGNNNV